MACCTLRLAPDMTVRLGDSLASSAGVPRVGMLGDDQATAVGSEDAGDECFSPERGSESHVANEAPTPRIITNLVPTQILEGTSGVYLLTDRETGVGVAVFKPLDEENLPEEASSWAVSNGMGHFRERAAFMVSDEILEGYSGVPPTVIATVRHDGWAGGEKRGSLQRFVTSNGDMADRGPAGVPAEQVHKVGILDILLFNMDRHEGNLLLCGSSSPRAGGSLSLVPIDHGLCLPEIISQHTGPNHELLRSMYFVWQNWPQARQPFSDVVRGLIDRQLADDLFRSVVARLTEDMGRNSLTCGALTTLKIGAMVLKNGVRAGLNLSEIAEVVQTVLPDVLQASWEEAGTIGKADDTKNMRGFPLANAVPQSASHQDGEDAADRTSRHWAVDASQHAAAEGRPDGVELSPVAVVPYREKRRSSSGAVNIENDDKMYLVWEALLLMGLERRLIEELRSRSGAANVGQSASAAAATDVQDKEPMCRSNGLSEAALNKLEQGIACSNWVNMTATSSEAEPIVRVEYLENDDRTGSTDESGSSRLVEEDAGERLRRSFPRCDESEAVPFDKDVVFTHVTGDALRSRVCV